VLYKMVVPCAKEANPTYLWQPVSGNYYQHLHTEPTRPVEMKHSTHSPGREGGTGKKSAQGSLDAKHALLCNETQKFDPCNNIKFFDFPGVAPQNVSRDKKENPLASIVSILAS